LVPEFTNSFKLVLQILITWFLVPQPI